MNSSERFRLKPADTDPGSRDDSPKIIVATLMRPVGETGVQSHFNEFLRHLAGIQRPCECITPFSVPASMVVPVFAVRRILERISGTASVWWYRYWHYLFLRLALNLALKATGPAIVYAQCPLSAKAALETRNPALHRVVLVVHFNESEALEWAEKGAIARNGQYFQAISELEERVIPTVDGLVFVSQFMRERVYNRIPAARGVCSAVIPNFVEQRMHQSHVSAPSDLVCIGTLEPRKNQAYLLKILAECKRRGHSYSLSLIGDGPDRAALEAMANALGIQDQVKFLGFQRDAARLLPGHRLYCHAANVESFPIAILEALAAGIPVIAAPVGGIPEVFSEGIEGRFWPLDDTSRGADILIELMDNPSLCAAMGTKARNTYLSRFSVSVVGPRLERFLVAPLIPCTTDHMDG